MIRAMTTILCNTIYDYIGKIWWQVVLSQINTGFGQMGVVPNSRVRPLGISLVITLISHVDALVCGTSLAFAMEKVHMIELVCCLNVSLDKFNWMWKDQNYKMRSKLFHY